MGPGTGEIVSDFNEQVYDDVLPLTNSSSHEDVYDTIGSPVTSRPTSTRENCQEKINSLYAGSNFEIRIPCDKESEWEDLDDSETRLRFVLINLQKINFKQKMIISFFRLFLVRIKLFI